MENIVVISPGFFHIDSEIRSELLKNNRNVLSLIERPNSIFVKAIIRLRVPIISKIVNKRIIDRLLEEIPKDSIVYYFNPEVFSEINLPNLNSKTKKIHFYFWDSTKLKPNLEGLARTIPEKIFTFDSQDAANFKLEYLPLFRPNFPTISTSNKYDVVFVGTIYGKRLKYLINFSRFAKRNHLRFFAYAYCKTVFHFVWYSFCKPKDTDFIITRDKMNRQELYENLASSKAVLDLAEPNQFGMSARTFEAMELGCKIITNNGEALKFFEDDNNVVSIRRFADELYFQEFLSEPWVNRKFYEDFTLTNFVKRFRK